MKHPVESDLALYAGGDLGFFQRLRVSRHLRNCSGCRRSADAFTQSRASLRAHCAELPSGLEWDRLAAEMTANIRVGLAAGECVAAPPVPRRQLSWRPALAVAGFTVLVMSGWWLNVPGEQRESLSRGLERIWKRDARIPPDSSVYLEANRAGIQFRENGSALTLMHPSGGPAVISVSMQGSMRARYIDSDTGQVTITNVYAQ